VEEHTIIINIISVTRIALSTVHTSTAVADPTIFVRFTATCGRSYCAILVLWVWWVWFNPTHNPRDNPNL